MLINENVQYKPTYFLIKEKTEWFVMALINNSFEHFKLIQQLLDMDKKLK
jgi:hypothetical protein